MTALTDTISWGATLGATGYTIGVRDTTAPASQAGAYLWFATSTDPSVLVSALGRGTAQYQEALPTGVLLAAAVQAQITTVDANGISTAQTLSDWSAEITFTVDAPSGSQGASMTAGRVAAGLGVTVQPPTLAAPTALAVSS